MPLAENILNSESCLVFELWPKLKALLHLLLHNCITAIGTSYMVESKPTGIPSPKVTALVYSRASEEPTLLADAQE